MRTIALLSFKEIIYKRIFLITLLMTFAFLAFYGVANHFANQDFAEGGELATDQLQRAFLSTHLLTLGLYFSSFITALLAILATVGSLSGEVESHQIDTLLARPLHRRDVVLGKFVGLGGMMVAYALFLFAGIFAINQIFGDALRMEIPTGNLLLSSVFFAMQPLVIVAAALWLSSRTSTINGGVILIILFVTGFIGGFLEQFGVALQNTSLQNIGILSSLIFPTDSLFRMMTSTLLQTDDSPIDFTASMGPFANLSEPSNLMIVYAVLYALLALVFAMRKFAKRDV